MSSGRNQSSQASSQFTLRVLSWLSSATLVHIIVTFEVSNPRKQHWPEAEADRIYLSTVQDLAAEFRLPQVPHARFKLVLGADEDAVDMNTRELRLKKWNKYFYAEGVLRLSFDQMLSTSEKMRLARRAVVESDAAVRWNEIRASSRASEFWYEDARPARGWASQQPR